MIAFEDHTGISEAAKKRILAMALSRGGDFAEIYAEYRLYTSIYMEEDIIKETAETISLGVGIRVLAGEKTGYGYTNDPAVESLRRAALTAASIADSGKTPSLLRFRKTRPAGDFYPLARPVHRAALEDKIGIVKRAYLACQESDP